MAQWKKLTAVTFCLHLAASAISGAPLSFSPSHLSSGYGPIQDTGFYITSLATGEWCGFENDLNAGDHSTLNSYEYFAKFDCSGAYKDTIFLEDTRLEWKDGDLVNTGRAYTLIEGARCYLQLDWITTGPSTLLANEHFAKFDCRYKGPKISINNNRMYSEYNGQTCGLQWDWDKGEPDTILPHERVAKFDCSNNGHGLQFTYSDVLRSGQISRIERDDHVINCISDCSMVDGQGAPRFVALDRSLNDPIRSGDRVAFYFNAGWFSCWDGGEDCYPRSCPGDWPGSFELCYGEQFRVFGKNRGCEISNPFCTGPCIDSQSECTTGEVLRDGDEIMILYDGNRRNQDSTSWYVSTGEGDAFLGFVGNDWEDPLTRTCPGRFITSQDWDDCDLEVFSLVFHME